MNFGFCWFWGQVSVVFVAFEKSCLLKTLLGMLLQDNPFGWMFGVFFFWGGGVLDVFWFCFCLVCFLSLTTLKSPLVPPGIRA